MHQYDRDVLLHIRDTMSECDMQPNYRFNDIVLPGQNWVTDQPANARGQRVRKRGRRGGALLRLRRRNLRPPLPSMFLSNVRSLRNKTDEFLCNLQTNRDYKHCSIFCFTETWLDATIPNSAMQPPGLTIYRSDRSRDETGKTRGGGVCFLINDRWATDVKILSKTCSVDIETLTIVCRPFYLPREFSSIILTAVYIPPQANTDAAVIQLSDIVTQAELSQPDSFVIVTGDFNKANPKKEMPKFIQQVTCATRDGRTLDHCYTTIKGAYRSIHRAPRGRSDHAMVYLVPTYKQQLKRVKPTVKTVKQWSVNAMETLRGCFECTDWGVFKEAAADIDEYTETVSDYITFCEGLCIPTKTITIYPNDKPWFNTSIKHKLQVKHDAFKANDKDKYKKARYEAENAIKTGKAKYRDKLEENLSTNNSKNIWQGLKAITNYKPSPKNTTATDTNLPDRLNDFYSRFDKLNTTSPSCITPSSSLPPFAVDEYVVRSMFQRLNSRKAAGPDNISPCLLKLCADQLSSVFTDIFNVSLSQCKIPHCFKKSTIIPVPKKSTASCLNDYRPVALTSVVMKTLERLVLQFLKSIIDPLLDQFQFAYRNNRSVDDAVAIGLFHVLKHLDSPNTYARILFVDFSSAFNTIIPSKLFDKIQSLGVPQSMCLWILDFLLNRPQVVKIGDNLSSSVTLSTGTPQGCVLSPMLYSLFTHDCLSCHVGTTIFTEICR